MLLCLDLQGCGLVEYAQHSEAAAAMEALAGRYVWRGAHGPMAVEWYQEITPAPARKAQAAWPAASVQVPGLVGLPGACTPAGFIPTAAGQSFQLSTADRHVQELPSALPGVLWGL